MSLLNNKLGLLRKHLDLKAYLCALVLVASFILFAINGAFFHYHGDLHTSLFTLPMCIGFLALIGLGFYIEECPRLSFISSYLGFYFFICFILNRYESAVQLTPFHLIDKTLLHIDQLMGFSTAGVVHFTQAHPLLENISRFFYKFLFTEIGLFAFVLILFGEKRQVDILFRNLLLTGFIGFTIYYFFPTTVPAHVIHNAAFPQEEYGIIKQFYQVHSGMMPTSRYLSLIAFPSYHVIWSVLFAYAFKNRKFIFIPLVIVNAIIILSTLTLGWHFLTDVIAGVIIAVGSIIVVEKTCKVKDLSVSSPLAYTAESIWNWVRHRGAHEGVKRA